MKVRGTIVAAATALLLVIPGGAVVANGSVTNGSFETGDTTGWIETIPVGGEITVESGGAPGGGMFFAQLKTNGPGSQTTLEQDVMLAAGESVIGLANFFDAEGFCGSFIDVSAVDILKDGFVIDTPFFRSSCDGASPSWEAWIFTAFEAGTFTVRARIENGEDDAVDSLLGLDAVTTATCTISGSGVLIGTSGADVICGSFGNDRIVGRGGNDLILGFGGNDAIDAGPGNDTVYAGSGDDRVSAGSGTDVVLGESGTDRCANAESNDCEIAG
ncbi:MAG: calcium-binding protein [Actinomycetota bacterium]